MFLVWFFWITRSPISVCVRMLVSIDFRLFHLTVWFHFVTPKQFAELNNWFHYPLYHNDNLSYCLSQFHSLIVTMTTMTKSPFPLCPYSNSCVCVSTLFLFLSADTAQSLLMFFSLLLRTPPPFSFLAASLVLPNGNISLSPDGFALLFQTSSSSNKEHTRDIIFICHYSYPSLNRNQTIYFSWQDQWHAKRCISTNGFKERYMWWTCIWWLSIAWDDKRWSRHWWLFVAVSGVWVNRDQKRCDISEWQKSAQTGEEEVWREEESEQRECNGKVGPERDVGGEIERRKREDGSEPTNKKEEYQARGRGRDKWERERAALASCQWRQIEAMTICWSSCVISLVHYRLVCTELDREAKHDTLWCASFISKYSIYVICDAALSFLLSWV